MKTNIVIRTSKDRLRYTFLFEMLLIAILAPVGAFVLDRPVFDVGFLAVVLAAKAMIVGLGYNWLFDLWDVRANRIPSERSLGGRIIHAIGFEAGLVATSLPIVIFWLDLTLLQALMMDVAVTSFIVIYTLVFSWCYDTIFPVIQTPKFCEA